MQQVVRLLASQGQQKAIVEMKRHDFQSWISQQAQADFALSTADPHRLSPTPTNAGGKIEEDSVCRAETGCSLRHGARTCPSLFPTTPRIIRFHTIGGA
jgi:hypothetical protein